MVKICPKCGNKNQDDAFWCNNCNSKISNVINVNQYENNIKAYPEKKFNQIIENNKSKSNENEIKKQKFGIKSFIFIIIIIIVIIVVFGGFQISAEEEKFIGTWENSSGYRYIFENGFFSKTITLTSTSSTFKGSWRCENEKLYLEIKLESIDYKIKACYDYIFQGDQLILNSCNEGIEIVLTKI